ncbi:quinone oxidoreductase family protein [Lichenicoccus roseus]|uniref:Quinone oxidoreductase n=1 Tax=Lichenicoccus roseus TaxID=2683649 RepID=A0A5R9J3V6_9PROT|nr:quinone oxidoreductase [Lichenicoccus roseus]TLU71543.1 quinone oxidoreductase [Lichenicoccus roseus]
MSKAIRIHEYGGPEVLQWEDVPAPEPGPGEALILQHAVGLNYIDIYYRTGVYKVPGFPAVLGMEGAGVVEAVGPGVTSLAPGDRVAYSSSFGSYATRRVVAVDRLVKLPDSIDFTTAAGMMLRGLTVQALLRQVRPLQAGDTILVHAAAGGIGLLMCQWASHLGARVIGVVSTPEKAEVARANGAVAAIVGLHDLAAQVKHITDGAMVPVVYDSVGKDSFIASLDCLAPRGLMVSFGNASGEVTGVNLSQLSSRGSLYVTRPTLMSFIATRQALESSAAELFEMVRTGAVKITVGQQFALQEAAEAHRAMESRATTGSTVLIPG